MIVNTLRFSFKGRHVVIRTRPCSPRCAAHGESTEPVVVPGTVGRYYGRSGTEGCYAHLPVPRWRTWRRSSATCIEPVHIDGDWLIIPHLAAARRVPGFSDDPDPDLDAKILALHTRKARDVRVGPPPWTRSRAGASFGDRDPTEPVRDH